MLPSLVGGLFVMSHPVIWALKSSPIKADPRPPELVALTPAGV
jgi:hypothetical protein